MGCERASWLAGAASRWNWPGIFRGEGDRETDWAGVAAVGEPGGRALGAEAAQAAGEHGECRAHVRPGHQVTEAVVDPAAETEVRRPVPRGGVEVTSAGPRLGARPLAEQADGGARRAARPAPAAAGRRRPSLAPG